MVSNNVKYNVPMQALGQSAPTGMPMQGVGDIKESVNNSYVARRVNNSEDSPFKLPLWILTWLGANTLVDKINKSFSGDFETSTFGKIGKWADGVTERVKPTTFGKFLLNVREKVSNGTNWLTQRNKTAFALKNYSTSPEWELAKWPFEGLNGFLTGDVKQLYGNFLKPIEDFSALEQYGLSRKEIDAIYDNIKKLPHSERAAALHKAELKALGFKDDIIERISKTSGITGMNKAAKAAKIRKLGFSSFKEYMAWEKDAFANKKLIYNALDKADKNLKLNGWRRYKLFGSKHLGKLYSNILGRHVTVTELKNKYHVLLNKGAKSTLGRSLQKGLGWLLEGTTGRFGGGKFISLTMTMILADSLINAFKAPKGEKFMTFSERQVNDFSYIFSLPLGLMAMHKVGGLKYKGMTPDEVKSYRTALQEFKEKYKNGFYKDNKALRKADAKAVKGMLKKGFWQKIGRFLNIGNETTAVGGAKFFRNCVGVPLRLILAAQILNPFIANTCTKLSHLIFGRPTNSILDEEKEPEIPPQEKMEQIKQVLINLCY